MAYYQRDFVTATRLIAAISSATLALEPCSQQDFLSQLNTGLRAILCQPSAVVDTQHLVALYRLLPPRIPTARNLDLHVMFQCYFNFTNALNGWHTLFKRHAEEHHWHDYNAVQLAAGIAIVHERIHTDKHGSLR